MNKLLSHIKYTHVLSYRKVYCFSSQSSIYNKYLNGHIIKSLQKLTTSPNKQKCKQNCEKYFLSIVNKHTKGLQQQKLNIKSSSLSLSQSIITNKLNMIFSASFQLQNLQQSRDIICKMIEQDKIIHQSQLDKILKWLFKEIKFNKNINKNNIIQFIKQQENNQKKFNQEIQLYFNNCNKEIEINKQSNQNVNLNLNNICKIFRDKYPYIDSKLIFQEVKKRINHMNNNINNNINNMNNNINNSINKQTKSSNINSSIQQNKFWDKIHKIKPRLIKQQLNTPQEYQTHLSITQNRLRFRFPPQPNGYLHIGHIKSIRMNFQSAKRLNGVCYLRYDDTNPDKETHEYIEEIEKNVRWMGYVPDKVNFTSDYFEEMMQYASKLIKEGKAYVCGSTQEQIQLQRKQKRSNKYRDNSIQYSNKIFPHLSPQQTLRLKLDPSSNNPTLRDPIIYRFKSTPHPRTFSKYSIYPMYDFAHCISDSIEHIDYSLCSLQFQIRRQLYYKILDMLGLYKPIVWEFSRLNVKNNFISKRKIKGFIQKGNIQGWDDPRLLTIKAMQRKGIKPQMLNQFIDKINSSRNGNQKYVTYTLLEKQMKKIFYNNSIKLMVLRNIQKVSINHNNTSIINHNTSIMNNNSNNRYIKQLCSSSQIYIQQQQYCKLKQNLLPEQQIILKHCGVFKFISSSNLLIPSSKSIQQLKNQSNNNVIPILSWLSSNMIKQKVVYYDYNLVDQNQQFNSKSRRDENIYVESGFDKVKQDNDYDKIYCFDRVGYFKLDKKSNQLICCVQI